MRPASVYDCVFHSLVSDNIGFAEIHIHTSAMLFWDFLFCFFFGVSFGTFVNESASRHIFLSDFFMLFSFLHV